MKKLLGLIVLLALAGCGIKSGSNKDQLKEKEFHLTDEKGEQVVDGYAYELNGDSCTTGFHGPMSLENYCSELLDEAKNQNCASAARTVAYKQDCSAK
jgi:hypothetical protein